ncbi:alpha/beta hydrolase family protein [Phytohabitans sp. LJ34]|uniref:alpha/beta hydrolase family protein n=1 Tax=Phytohabitans sp. LJ34 TaxID=3452217 RepID=UPI003F8890E4
MRVGRGVVAAAVSLALALGGGGAAWAEPGQGASAAAALPDGWEVRRGGSGFELVWHAPAPVPVGGAMVEFHAGDRLLGWPVAAADQRTFRLAVDGVALRRLTDPRVLAGGRRLDVPAGAVDRRQGVAKLAQLPPNAVDPGVPGPFSTISGEYTLPDVSLPGFAAPVEMRGFVVAPQATSGQRPLVLFLHGRHATCYQGTAQPTLAWPCPAGWTPVPSHLGYQRAQQLLASQGYVTVSIAANGVNAQDGGLVPPADGGAQARSSLVRIHLARWADWAGSGRPGAPAVVRSAPVTDMTRVLLVGHSRGGEGVGRAAVDSLTPPPAGRDGYTGAVRWQIRGLALIAPTLLPQNPAPDVPSMTILSSCDGDVSDLQGQQYVDATRGVGRGLALHGAAYVVGANHNYYNTEWTPGLSAAPSFDDFASPHDPICRSASPQRLTPEQQQKVGATYTAAAAAAFVAGDDQVRPLLDGSGVRAPSVDPAVVLSHAVGGNRAPLVVPDSSTVVSGTGGVLCQQVTATTTPTSCDSTNPHFDPFEPIRPEAGRYAVRVRWTALGTPVTIQPPAAVSLTNAQAVALRVVVPIGSPGTRFDVAIADSAGRRAVLGTSTLDPMLSHTWGQEVRMPLTNAVTAGLDLGRVTRLEIVPRAGESWAQVWLLDAWGWRPGLPAPQPVGLPRADLGELTVPEGDSGTVTHHVPAQISGSGNGRVRVFVVDPATGGVTATVVTVPPGSTTIPIPIQVTGDTQPGDGRTYVVAAKAVSGASVGDAYGLLTVQDDDG